MLRDPMDVASDANNVLASQGAMEIEGMSQNEIDAAIRDVIEADRRAVVEECRAAVRSFLPPASGQITTAKLSRNISRPRS